MSNDYNDKSWTERTNWILTVIALALVAILSIGLLCALFIQPQDNDEEAVPKDGAIISETAENGISLMSAKIMPVAYAESGVSALADTAYTLTATVEPDYSGEKEFDWSIKFQNASSSWANGKTVTNYVTVTPTSDGANTATIECKQSFGEKIIVTCTSRDYAGLSATCTVDYAQRITGMDVTLEGSRTGDRDIPEGEEVTINFTYYGGTSSYNVYTVRATATYSDVYTLAESATCNVSFLTSAGTGDSHTYFNGNEMTGSYGYYSRTYNDAVTNAIGKTFSFDNHMFEAYNFRREYSVLQGGYPADTKANYADLTGEELAERYLTQDQGTVLWRVAASVEGKYGSYTREDSYLMYSWPAAGNYANLSLSEGNLIF